MGESSLADVPNYDDCFPDIDDAALRRIRGEGIAPLLTGPPNNQGKLIYITRPLVRAVSEAKEGYFKRTINTVTTPSDKRPGRSGDPPSHQNAVTQTQLRVSQVTAEGKEKDIIEVRNDIQPPIDIIPNPVKPTSKEEESQTFAQETAAFERHLTAQSYHIKQRLRKNDGNIALRKRASDEMISRIVRGRLSTYKFTKMKKSLDKAYRDMPSETVGGYERRVRGKCCRKQIGGRSDEEKGKLGWKTIGDWIDALPSDPGMFETYQDS